MSLTRRSAGKPVGIRHQMGILRPVGLTVGSRAVSRIVSAVAGQQSSGGKSEQTQPQPTRLTQRPAFPAVRGGDDRPLEDVAKVPEVVLAVPRQAKGGFGELRFSRPGRNSTIR